MRQRIVEFYGTTCPSEEQVLAMAEMAPHEETRDLILTAAYTGLRGMVELARVEAEHFDPDTDTLFVPEGKAAPNGKRRPRMVPVVSHGRAALRRTIARCTEYNWIFRQPRNRNAWHANALGQNYNPLRDATGTPGTFHSLRHFYASYLLDHGVAELDVAVALGHFDREGRPNSELVRETYGHANHLKAIARIGAAFPPTAAETITAAYNNGRAPDWTGCQP